MKKAIIMFIIFSFAAKIIAFGRELLLAYFYGTSIVSDVFLLSMTLPVIIFGFIASGIISGFIPIYSKVKKEGERTDGCRFTTDVLNTMIMFSIALVIIYYVFSNDIIKLIAIGFSKDDITMAINFTNISIWVIPFSCIISILTAYLQANEKLNATAVVSIPLNIGIVFTIVIAYFTSNIGFLPIGFLLSSSIQVIYILIVARRSGFRYYLQYKWGDENLKIFVKNLFILTISNSIQQINLLIDRTLATSVMVGGLSVFEYGNRINDFILGMSIVPISTAVFPNMAKHAEENEIIKKMILKGSYLFFILMTPITVIVMFFSKSIVKIIYYRGAFGEQSLENTTEVVFFYGLGLLAIALRELLLKGFYAISDSKTPMINASFGVVVNIVLNFVLVKFMGVGGLALATSISAIVCVILLGFALKKKFQVFIDCSIFFLLGKILFVSILCGGGAYFVYCLLSKVILMEAVRLGMSLIIFGIVFVVLSLKWKIIMLEDILKVKRRNDVDS